MASMGDPFREILGELTDGHKWEVIRTAGWEDFSRRLADTITRLEPRRRQAIIMLLVALSTNAVTSVQVEEFLDGRDVDTDEELEALIAWLRQWRPVV
jgi:hypothetical protein